MTSSSAGTTIAVVGAAGQTGVSVLRALARQGARVRAVLHDPARESAVTAAGSSEVVIADLMDIDSLRAALLGADTVYVVTPPLHRHETAMVTNAVRAAEAVGVARFVYQSVLHPHAPEVRHHHRKALAEEVIRISSLRWTILQPGQYAQSPLKPALRAASDSDPGAPLAVRTVLNPESPFTVIDVEDIAEVTAKVLVDDIHDFATYELAGPQRQTIRELYEQVAVAWNRPVEVQVVDPIEGQQAYNRNSTLGQFADRVAMHDHYDRHGLVGNPTVARCLLGRDPTPFIDVARRVGRSVVSR
jgi:uncharacterized protein YbjT (DUF2867 family)